MGSPRVCLSPPRSILRTFARYSIFLSSRSVDVYRYMVYLRHYGFPSRLLNLSYSNSSLNPGPMFSSQPLTPITK